MPDEDVTLNTPNEATEEVEKTETDETETAYVPVEDSEDELAKTKELNQKLFERAKKAEAEMKKLRAEKAEFEKISKSADEIKAHINPDLIAKEVRLLASLTDEEISEARDISKGKNISLEEALKTKSFLAFQRELRDEERKQKAKLSASKGSSQEEQKGFKPGLTTEEHKALWRESMGG